MRGAGQGAQDAFGIGAVGGLPEHGACQITVVSADSRQRQAWACIQSRPRRAFGVRTIVGGAFARVLGLVSRWHLQHLMRHAHLGQQLAARGLADAR